ncbi:MAG: TIGR01906 family membrane protein [Clostridiaceae bacterium]|nr:TIGR01906 family membrane protein [Clostridiaceae bacterium]
MKTIKVFGYVLLGIMLSIVLLLTAVEMVSFNVDHYMKEYEKHNITTVTGMDKENLQHVTEELLAYLKEDIDDLDIKAVVKGEEREVFGEREKLHMVDVKHLFIAGRWVRNSGIMALVLVLLLFIRTDRYWRRNLSKAAMYTAMANVDLIILLFLLMHINFQRYFDYFHYIFFDNDLWLLDPDKEILIQMLPQEFFYNTALNIAIIYIGSIVVVGIVGYLYHKKRRE